MQGSQDLQNALIEDVLTAQAGVTAGGAVCGAGIVHKVQIHAPPLEVQDILVKGKKEEKHSDSDSGKEHSSYIYESVHSILKRLT